jgi:hypothetical protein
MWFKGNLEEINMCTFIFNMKNAGTGLVVRRNCKLFENTIHSKYVETTERKQTNIHKGITKSVECREWLL